MCVCVCVCVSLREGEIDLQREIVCVSAESLTQKKARIKRESDKDLSNTFETRVAALIIFPFHLFVR